MQAKKLAGYAALAAAATEFTVHGFTPRGMISATSGFLLGAVYCTQNEKPRIILKVLSVNQLANAIFYLAEARLTLGGVVARMGTAFLATRIAPRGSVTSVVGTFSLVMGVEMVATMAFKGLKTGAGLVTVGTGLCGLAVAVILTHLIRSDVPPARAT